MIFYLSPAHFGYDWFDFYYNSVTSQNLFASIPNYDLTYACRIREILWKIESK